MEELSTTFNMVVPLKDVVMQLLKDMEHRQLLEHGTNQRIGGGQRITLQARLFSRGH